jgi:uracil-DNA glycosylase
VSGSGVRRAIRELLDRGEDYFRDGFRVDRLPEPEAPPPGSVGHAIAAEAGSLEDVAREVASCARCPLGRMRRTAVPGEGVPSPLVLAVGEGPGADEDASGRPFVGAAGQYLDKWLAAVGLDRKTNCFIANVLKCRPPGNRDPQPQEVQACRGYLERQIAILRPRAILALGRFAAQTLTGSTQGITVLRSGTHEYRGIPLVATFHPSAVLRDNSLRAPVWEDLRRLKALLGNA